MRTFVYRGRSISVPVIAMPAMPAMPPEADMPATSAMSEDDRCEECRAAGIAVCTHHDEPHVHPAPASQHMETHGTEHGSEHEREPMPMPMPAHEHEPEPQHEAGHDAPQQGHMGHIPIEITVDGRTFPGHVNRKGQFHSHELPFMVFPTAEALGRAIANKLDWSEPHGRPAKSEKAE